jgi:hypothetical protein
MGRSCVTGPTTAATTGTTHSHSKAHVQVSVQAQGCQGAPSSSARACMACRSHCCSIPSAMRAPTSTRASDGAGATWNGWMPQGSGLGFRSGLGWVGLGWEARCTMAGAGGVADKGLVA